MPLTEQQIERVGKRLSRAMWRRRDAITDKFTTHQGVHLTVAQKIEALRTGEFTVEDVSSDHRSWSTYVTFTAEVTTYTDEAAYRAALGALDDEYNEVLDQCILGDAPEALELVKAFAAKAPK